jgi:ferredoxin-NADP reductase
VGALANFARWFVPAHYLPLDGANDGIDAVVCALRDEDSDTRTLELAPQRAWRRHRAGQHVRVHVERNGLVATRMYAIASPEDRGDGRFEITVRARPGGSVSTLLARELAIGATLRVGQPEGSFVCELGAPFPILLIGCGVGGVPLASMVRTFAVRDAMPNVVELVVAGDDPELFAAELDTLAQRFPSYRRIRASLDGQLDELVPDWRTRRAWACGSPTVVDWAQRAYRDAGLEQALAVERFAASRVAHPEHAAGGSAHFTSSHVTAPADAQMPLLEVAARAGVAIPHGCRLGICRTCDSTLVSGRVRDLRGGGELDAPGAVFQPCVYAALGDVEVAR